jgi:hypothetical protein
MTTLSSDATLSVIMLPDEEDVRHACACYACQVKKLVTLIMLGVLLYEGARSGDRGEGGSS